MHPGTAGDLNALHSVGEKHRLSRWKRRTAERAENGRGLNTARIISRPYSGEELSKRTPFDEAYHRGAGERRRDQEPDAHGLQLLKHRQDVFVDAGAGYGFGLKRLDDPS